MNVHRGLLRAATVVAAVVLALADFFTAEAATTFSFVVIPDTQDMLQHNAAGRLAGETTWIVNNRNRADLKIAGVAHVGDIVNFADDWHNGGNPFSSSAEYHQFLYAHERIHQTFMDLVPEMPWGTTVPARRC